MTGGGPSRQETKKESIIYVSLSPDNVGSGYSKMKKRTKKSHHHKKNTQKDASEDGSGSGGDIGEGKGKKVDTDTETESESDYGQTPQQDALIKKTKHTNLGDSDVSCEEESGQLQTRLSRNSMIFAASKKEVS